MPVFQQHTWICDQCGLTRITIEEVMPGDDPIIGLENEVGERWDYIEVGRRGLVVCPECKAKLSG